VMRDSNPDFWIKPDPDNPDPDVCRSLPK